MQIEVSFLPNISSFPQYRLIKFVFYLYIRPGRINEILRYLTLNVFKTGSLWQEKTGSSSLLFYTLPPKTQLKKTFIPKCFHTIVISHKGNKNHTFTTFALQIKWLVSIWNATLHWNELNMCECMFPKRIRYLQVFQQRTHLELFENSIKSASDITLINSSYKSPSQ